jgi:hypothetical protein
MKTSIFILFFLNIFFIKLLLCDEMTKWTDPTTNLPYDFTYLKNFQKNEFIVKDKGNNEDAFTMNYHIKIGDNLGRTCKDKRASVIEFLQILGQDTETCEILGKFEEKNVGLLDPLNPYLGIYVEYGGGEICSNIDDFEGFNQPRKTRFKIYCSAFQDNNFILDLPGETQGTTKCILDFKINSPAGCPYGVYYGLTYTRALFYLVVLFILYICVGMIYKIKVYNLWGTESIPNIEFWRNFPTYVQLGIMFCFHKINNLFDCFLNKYNKKELEGYEDI